MTRGGLELLLELYLSGVLRIGAGGWCYCEAMMSGIVKASDQVLDLDRFSKASTKLADVIAECAKGRTPPLTPTEFEKVCAAKLVREASLPGVICSISHA